MCIVRDQRLWDSVHDKSLKALFVRYPLLTLWDQNSKWSNHFFVQDGPDNYFGDHNPVNLPITCLVLGLGA